MNRQHWVLYVVLSTTFFVCIQYGSHFTGSLNQQRTAPSIRYHSSRLEKNKRARIPPPVKKSRLLFSAPQKCAGRTIYELVQYIANQTHSAVKRDFVMNLDKMVPPNGNFSAVVTKVVRERVGSSPPLSLTYTHFSYVDFKDQDVHPVYFSVIRDPFERQRSFYYFKRYGDTMAETEQSKVWRSRIAALNLSTDSYDLCVREQRDECVGQRSQVGLIRHFCGYGQECYGNPEDILEAAKRNIDGNFYVIGLTEEFEDFLKVLEVQFPVHFSNAMKHYKSFEFSKIVSTTKTNIKLPASNETRAAMMPILKYEYELYDFIRKRFHLLLDALNMKA